LAAAETDLTVAREIFEQLVQQSAEVPLHLVGLATVFDNLGNVWERRGKPADAVTAFEKAIELQEAACTRAPGVAHFGSLLERHRANLNRVLTVLGQSQDS
jgi:hypothetical protein